MLIIGSYLELFLVLVIAGWLLAGSRGHRRHGPQRPHEDWLHTVRQMDQWCGTPGSGGQW
jgi:hypothetical protein